MESDEAVIAAILAGDEAAFGRVVTAYSGSLLRLARSFVPREGIAEELVQETWVSVLDGLGGFERRSSLKTWIFRILVNCAKSRAEREGRVVPFSSLARDPSEEEPEPAVDARRFGALALWRDRLRGWTDDAPEGMLLRKEMAARLQKAIEELPPNQRAVVLMRDVEGCSSEETCKALGVSEPNQRVLLHRGRARLRAAIERYDAGGPDVL